LLSDTDLERLRRNLDYLDAAEKRRVLDLLEEREKEQQLAAARTRFIEYVQRMWPDVVLGAHHTLMAEAYERIVFGKSKRLIINIAPRHSKSEMTSWLLPTWFLGHNPKAKIMQCMNTQDLASGFGRRVRNVISREAIATEKKGLDPYHDVFPELDLAKDSGAAYHWHTTHGGEYYAVGVGGKIAGRGADLLVIDDPHALYTSTLLPTPEGFIAIGDIEVGDEVFGPDGKPTKVIAVSEVWNDRPLYEVIAPDGSKILCDAAHLWTYRSDTKVSAPFRTESAERIVARQLANNPILPTVAPVEYPEQSLPIDPYVLGYWLGNGTAEAARITSHPDDTVWVREQFEAAGYATSDLKDERSFGVLGLWSLLRTMDLLGRKRVPPSYMVASPRQRVALLQGLMDSDGTVSKAGQCSFDNTDRALVEAVQQLVLSFGVRTGTIQRIEPTRTGFATENPTYRVTFQMQDAARIPRKRDRLRHASRRGRSITIRKTDQRGPVRCITVEREDGLFLAGEGYIVTHNSEQEAKLAISNPEVFDQVYEWYVYGPRQRLQPNGKIILVQTRWSKRDLTGRLLQKMAEDDSVVADKWEQIEFPAILDEGTPNERALWPAYWPLETQQATRAALPVSAWQSQYQQNPVSGQSAIFKREYWRIWGEDKTEDVEAGRATCPGPRHAGAWQNLEPPACEYILHSWDTAIKKNQRADFSAFTSWGVFKAEDPVTGLEVNHIIMLSAWKARLEFPELKKKVREFYDEDRPDTLLIEDKGSGSSLIQELRSMGIAVENFSYGRGQRGVSNDKIARANTISDVFASRYVWRPARRWAEEVETELSDFPGGAHDDYVDSTVQAMIRFRAGNLVATANDVEEEAEPRRFMRKRYY